MGQSKLSLTLNRAPVAAGLFPQSLAELEAHVTQTNREQIFEAGRQAGLTEAHEGAAKALDAAALRLDKAREEALDSLGLSAVELAVEIARQIVQVEIQAGNYDLERIVRGALSVSGQGRGEAIVHLAPKDHARLQHIPFREGTVLAEDSTLAPGDVHLEVPQGLLVREISDCLATIGEQLLEDLA